MQAKPHSPLRRAAASILRGDWRIYRRQDADRIVEIRLKQPGLVAGLAIAILLAVFLPARVWIVLLAGLGALLALTHALTLSLARGVRVERRLLHTWIQVGDLLEESFTLHNESSLPVLAAEVEDHSDIPGYSTSAVRGAPPRGTYRWRQQGRSQRRGLYHLGPTLIRLGDPLGIFAATVSYPDVREVLVLPPVLQDLAVSPTLGGEHGAALARQRSLEERAAISGLRDYRPGDPIRRIHWPRSIRHGRFLVKEFDREMGGTVWLVLDLDAAVQAGAGDDSTVEYGVIWAASWAWHLLRQGRAVGLFAYGPERVLIRPASGRGHLHEVLRALAPVEVGEDRPLAILLNEIRPLLARGDSLVVITPSAREGWVETLLRPDLRAAVKGVALLDAASFGESSDGQAGSAEAVHALLNTLGIRVQVIQRQTGLMARPATPGSGDWDFTVTGFGRVVVRSRPAEARP